ncbi:hypothetical protein BH10PSE19_BH10PSE19_13740 [soil metagenome]
MKEFCYKKATLIVVLSTFALSGQLAYSYEEYYCPDAHIFINNQTPETLHMGLGQAEAVSNLKPNVLKIQPGESTYADWSLSIKGYRNQPPPNFNFSAPLVFFNQKNEHVFTLSATGTMSYSQVKLQCESQQNWQGPCGPYSCSLKSRRMDDRIIYDLDINPLR